ncbi:MAG TPA: formyltransferase family protein [Pyrinomonadaceae bacterium]|jgi:methionyl-tRNA formyltransferase
MRIGILSSSLPAALKIHSEVKTVPGCHPYILLCRVGEETRLRRLFKHAARFVLKEGRFQSLRLLARGRVIMLPHPLDDARTLARLKRLRLDVGLHNLGAIYRDETIKAFRTGILNPHIGLLPRYRGRNVMEWSLLEGRATGITLFFIDSGIDTGPRIVLREEVDVSHCGSIESAKAYLFNLDAQFFRRALELLRNEEFSFEHNDGTGRRYYVMSRLFQNVVEELIKANG